jgi:hypothetical protein
MVNGFPVIVQVRGAALRTVPGMQPGPVRAGEGRRRR